MGRLRALLHAQQEGATRNATAQQAVLHVARPRECDTQQPATDDQMTEFERLLTIVGPAYNTPAEQYPIIRQTAADDIMAALECYRDITAKRGITLDAGANYANVTRA